MGAHHDGSLPLQRLMQWPAWISTPRGRVAAVLGGIVVVLKTISSVLPEQVPLLSAAILASVTACTTFGFFHLLRFLRKPSLPSTLRHSARLTAAALVLVSAVVLFHVLVKLAFHHLHLWAHIAQFGGSMIALGLVACAVLVLPTKPIDRETWIAACLDLATILLTGFLAFWLYALEPATADDATTSAVWRILIAGYTALSLVVLGALMMFFFRRHDSVPAVTLTPLAVGVVLLLATDVLPASNAVALAGPHAAMPFVGWGLFAVCVSVALAVREQSTHAAEKSPSSNAMTAAPIAATALAGLLLFSALMSHDLWMDNAMILLPSVFVALVLVIVRQTRIARDRFAIAEEMTRAKDVAETANRSRLQFLANISHDLRTPLNGILGCAQILLREKNITPKQRELIKTSQSCAEHLRTLIGDLLDLSKLESGRLELAPVDFDQHAFLSELVGSFRLQAETKNIQLDFEAGDSLPKWVNCDRKRLQQILGNLLHNAVKFTTHGEVSVKAVVERKRLVFHVRDTGCGILPDKLADLFKPFHVVDEKSIHLDGTGLGLSISKKLAEKMGGDISVKSVYGKGSTFTLDLPLAEAAPVVEAQRTIVDYQGHRRRILIVDDRPENRVILRSLLDPLDFLVMEAGSGEDALEQLNFAKPDVCILDLMMPEMDGFELCRRINALKLAPSPVCFALSAMAGEDVNSRCLEAGFREFVRKPVNLELLLQALHTHAGIEWVYGLIKPGPREAPPPEPDSEPMSVPAAEALTALTELARRGNIKTIEARLAEMVQADPGHGVFADRVRRYLDDFKVRELADWLASLSPTLIHASN